MPYNYIYSKPRRSSEEIEDIEEFKFPFGELDKKPYKQFDITFSAQHTHYYLSKVIGEPDGYTEMVHRMVVANPSDVIFIHLNTPGGQLDTGVQLINAMRNSEAKIVTILEATAYSLGTLLFLSGDEIVVNDNCMMMFHNFNGGLIGKGNELVSELEATVKWFTALAEDVYIPFLSREEFDRICRGEDMWMQTPEIKERLANMMKILEEESKAELITLGKEITKLERLAAIEKKAEKLTAVKKAPAKKARKSTTRSVGN